MKNVKDKKYIEKISVRFTEEELVRLRNISKESGLTISEYIRNISFKRQLIVMNKMTAINELRRLGGLIKHLYTLSGGVNQDKTRLVLDEIISAIKALSDDR